MEFRCLGEALAEAGWSCGGGGSETVSETDSKDRRELYGARGVSEEYTDLKLEHVEGRP